MAAAMDVGTASTVPLIKDGDWVVLYCPKDMVVARRVDKTSTVSIGKTRKQKLSGIIGHPYGTAFEISGNTFQPCTADDDLLELAEAAEAGAATNQDIVDRALGNQNLTAEHVEELKAKMRSHEIRGADIVKTLIEGSSSFDQRTTFSQAKYINRKREKHAGTITVLQPSTKTLADALHCHNPIKLCSLRPDSLAQCLTLTNIRAGIHALVVDATSGLLTGAVAERLGGLGRVTSVGIGLNTPGLDAVKMFQFPPAVAATIDTVMLDPLLDAAFRGKVSEAGSAALARVPIGGADALIVVARDSPTPLVRALLPFLAPGSPIAVFCIFPEPLLELERILKRSRQILSPRFADLWTRVIQVLPGRTHPLVMMHGSSGHTLTGNVVENLRDPFALAAAEAAEDSAADALASAEAANYAANAAANAAARAKREREDEAAGGRPTKRAKHEAAADAAGSAGL